MTIIQKFQNLRNEINDMPDSTREKSLAITKIDEARAWLEVFLGYRSIEKWEEPGVKEAPKK